MTQDYEKAFRAFVPKDVSGFIEDTASLKPVEDLFLYWKGGASGNAAVLIGSPGGSAPFVRSYLQQRFSQKLKCTNIELDRFAIDHDGLSGSLGAQLGIGRSVDVDELLKALAEADRQVVFLDNCHNTFRRRVNGFEPLFELQHILSSTRGKVLWILLWAPFSWYYLDSTIGMADHFDVHIECGGIRAELLERWIKLKHEATGFQVEFGHGQTALESDVGHWLPADLQDSFAKAIEGNFESAESIWLSSARSSGDKQIRIGNFIVPDPKALDLLCEEDLYILCSLLFHRQITLEALAEDMNLTITNTRRHLNHLANRGHILFGSDPATTCCLEPAHIPSIARHLDRKNLINVKENHGS